MQQNGENNQETNKIAIIGLANAGKTSLVKSFLQEFEMLTNLRPTQGVDRTQIDFFGRNILLWDFGGQESYLNKYLENPGRYFKYVTNVFFVVDIQDGDLLELDIYYFHKIYDEMINYSPDAKWSFLFHKSDPGFIPPLNWVNIKKNFMEKVVHAFDSNSADYEVFDTSIYNPFSIITAFSQSLLADISLFDSISAVLTSFCNTYQLQFGILFTEDFFELGHYAVDQIPPEETDKILRLFYGSIEHAFTGIHPRVELVYEGMNLVTSKFTLASKDQGLFFYLLIGYDRKRHIFGESIVEDALASLEGNLQKIFESLDMDDILRKAKKIGE